MNFFSILYFATTTYLLIGFGVLAQAQTMDDILKEMVEAAKKGEQSQHSGTYNNYTNDLLEQPQTQQPYQPMTRQQSQQYTTDKLLRALSEASKKPAGETKYQRNQRLMNLADEMRNQDAAISQRQIEYNQAYTRRMMGGSSGARTRSNTGTTGSNSAYEQKRAARMRASSNTTSTTTNPGAKPAGFGAGYAGGYTQPDQTLQPTGITTNSSRRARRTDLEAPLVIIVKDDPPPAPVKPIKQCKCKDNDTVAADGMICLVRNADGSFTENMDSYPGGGMAEYFPWTPACRWTVDGYGMRVD